eukprot:c16743_g1_i1 orf=3-242(-)
MYMCLCAFVNICICIVHHLLYGGDEVVGDAVAVYMISCHSFLMSDCYKENTTSIILPFCNSFGHISEFIWMYIITLLLWD